MFLDRLAGPDGRIYGTACDHRDALASQLRRDAVSLGSDGVAGLKARIVAALAPAASVILLDPGVGLPEVRRRNALPASTALALALEADGYGEIAKVGTTSLAGGFSPARAAELGASACKLLLPFRVDLAEQAARQEAVAAEARVACEAADLVLMLEPIVYSRPGQGLETEQFSELVLAGAERLAGLGSLLLKLQYPGSRAACGMLTASLGDVPWVLLGGGAAATVVEQQVADACGAGARGFVVGRSLWSDAIVEVPAEQERLLIERAVPRFLRLIDAARVASPERASAQS